MKLRKNFFLCLIAILAIFAIVSCGGNELPEVPPTAEEEDKPAGIPLDESTNLDAWRRACETSAPDNVEHTKSNPINVKVTGIVSNINGKNIYLIDEKDGALLIYGERPKTAPKLVVGDKVTVSISEITNNYGLYRADFDDVTFSDNITHNATLKAPKQITTQLDFNKLGYQSNLDYVTVCGRIAGAGPNGSKWLNIEANVPDSFEAYNGRPVINENTKVAVYSKSDAKLHTGDYVVLEGHMGSFGAPQLIVFKEEIKNPFTELPPAAASFGEFYAPLADKTSGAVDLYPNKIFTGIVAYADNDDIYIVSNTETPGLGRYAILGHKYGIPEDIKVGDTVKLTAANATFYDRSAQTTDFTVEKVTTTDNIGIPAVQAMAKEYTTQKALEDATKVNFYGTNANREFVKVTGTVSEKTESRFYVKLSTGKIYVKSTTEKKDGDSVTVYGVLSTNGKDSNTPRILLPTII